MLKGLNVDAHFCESVSKNPYRGKPNENQGPKTHQEDRSARKVQRNKCKRKQSTAKCKSAAEYRSAAKYSSLAEWLQQMKINWAQDPFQILLYTYLQQNANLPQNIDLSHNTVPQQNGSGRQRQIGSKTLLIQSTLSRPQRPKFFCVKGQA